MMAHAYTEPSTSPAATVNPLMPLFLAMSRRQAELARRVEESAARDRATREYLSRTDVKPGPKVLYLQTAYELGVGPGSHPNTDRAREFKTVVHSWLSDKTGMHRATVGAWLEAAVTAEVPLFRRRTAWETNPKTGDKMEVLQYAPVEGADWAATWAQPGAMPVPSTTRRQAKATKRAGDLATKNRATLAEAQRIVETLTCKACGLEGADLYTVCVHCGHPAEVAELTKEEPMEGAPRARPAHAPAREQVPPPCDHSPHSSTTNYQLSSQDLGCGHSPQGVPDEGEACAAPLTPQEALAAVLRVVAPAVLPYPNHIVMKGQPGLKYLTEEGPLTGDLLAAHFLGTATYGAGLCWPDPAMKSGRAAQAIAWDSDDELGRLIRGATLLRRRGLAPLVVKNPSKPNSGHLWLFFDAPVDPTDALARAEQIAPCLRAPEVPERFPSPTTTGEKAPGGRIRLPGGRYLTAGAPAVNVLVALAPEIGAPAWLDGTTPEGWAAIAGAVTHAPDLLVTWVDPAHRPKPPKAPVLARAATVAQVTGSGEFFKRFNAENRISEMVRVTRKGFFKSPWHEDASPSCKLDDSKGLWCDFSRDRKGGDAFDLWCALNGFWPDTADKPDKKAAYASLCPPEPKKKDGAGQEAR